MLFTKLHATNLYCFDNIEVDFTFPKKPVINPIPFEFVEGKERFNVKRVCILSGANASGKTSFGRVLCGIQNFIARKNLSPELQEAVFNKTTPARIVAEFVTVHDHTLHRVSISFQHKKASINSLMYGSVPIKKGESAVAVRKKLDAVLSGEEIDGSSRISFDEDDNTSERDAFNRLDFLSSCGWNYLFSRIEDTQNTNLSDLNKNVLFKVLKTFDPSVEEVTEAKARADGKNERAVGFNITFSNGDGAVIDMKGNATNPDRFSKGTFEGIKVATFITGLLHDAAGGMTFFLDEKMAYSHSDVEVHVLDLMIRLLHKNSQLFYTTHNCDILDMNLPVHSFLFFRKAGSVTEVVHPERSFNKNDRSLLNAMRNDIFRISPDSSLLDGIVK
jgi:hypothetical protein